ncbi:MAG: OmpA family protein [Candidatus Omnitrophica bacterium]|nr:OmpA family protein [Candidatus Omnitrophota bacterium]
MNIGKTFLSFVMAAGLLLSALPQSFAAGDEEKRKQDIEAVQKQFEWWPTDAKPAPVKDDKGGYWWWPSTPGTARPWGNRGYIYVNKIIFDYKEEELPAPQPQELRPSLLIKKILRNVKVYFDFDSAKVRGDAKPILNRAVKTLKKNLEADILITGNCDTRGPEAYNLKLGKRRGEAVKNYMLENGIPEERVRIVSRGKLDALAPVTDLVGMQKDRNAQFMIAEVEEVMIPYGGEAAPAENIQKIEEGKFIEETKEEVTTPVQVSTKEYTIKKGDTLWMIAECELGKGYRWKYIYELNKDKIKNPNKLKAGKKILIPVE